MWRTCRGESPQWNQPSHTSWQLGSFRNALCLCKACLQQRSQCPPSHFILCMLNGAWLFTSLFLRGRKPRVHHIRKRHSVVGRSRTLIAHAGACHSLHSPWNNRFKYCALFKTFERTSFLQGLSSSVPGSKLRLPWEQPGPLCQRQSSL